MSSPVLSAARLALAIKRFREERPDADILQAEPIAVVGIGCRMPGNVRSPEDFWQVVANGVDTVTEVPADRWAAEAYYDRDPLAPGKTNSRWGGFIADVDRFDPVLFGISPREAASIDPQQRLLLEVAWEAIQDSGRAPESQAGSRMGIFVGITLADYERFSMEDPGAIHANTCTGSYRSVASGRISFLLDVRGPSLSVDTACSSSLVAIHEACQSLRAGESEFALAGGVNLHLLPEHYIGLARLGMLAPDGRCKPFDASADGFVPSEGCGLVALKRLTDAVTDGDRIYAVIRGSALNQDGRSTSLTAPSGLAQQDVVARALRQARVPPSCVSYVETHGTGTALGDPIEVEALAAVLGEPQEGMLPCVLGAAKSNFGHLEAAAGVTGLIKAVLALYHEQIPGNLHFQKLNPHISLAGTRLSIASEPRPWPRMQTPRFAGVSSFGFSGTNAHIVLEEAPRLPARNSQPPELEQLLLISARTPVALNDAARQYGESLAGRLSRVAVYDICHAAATQRAHYEERLAIAGATHAELGASIEEFLAGRHRPGMARGRASGKAESVVFVCSGQGSQWARMGVSLLRDEPIFRRAIEECEAWIQRWAGWSLIGALSAPEAESKLSDTEYAQPAIFAIQVALARLFESWGVKPAAVIGHSAGEVAAAHISGALEIGEAARIVVLRGRQMAPGAGRGKMALVRLEFTAVFQVLAPYEGRVSVAAINGPQSTVISGDTEAVDALMKMWRERDISSVALAANYAFHSAQMDPFLAGLRQELGTVACSGTNLPMISTVLGEMASGATFDAAYWSRNVRATVQFSAAVKAAFELGLGTFLELGPHPVLVGSISEHRTASGEPAAGIGTLRRGQAERTAVLGALGQLHAIGYPVSWNALYPYPTPPVGLPGYPYQKQRFRFDRQRTGQYASPRASGGIFEPVWRPIERGRALPLSCASWVVAGSDAASREKLTLALRARGMAASGSDAAQWGQGNGVIWLVEGASAENPIDAGRRSLAAFMTALQDSLRQPGRIPVRFCLVTRGAVATPAEPACEGLFSAMLWGMLRSVQTEHPELGYGRVDLDPVHPDFDALAEEVALSDGEEEIAFHGGQRYAPRLEAKAIGSAVPMSPEVRGDATYLVTGGLGAIGLRCLEWLAAKGARSVVLVGRRGPGPEAVAAIEALGGRGVRIEVQSADIADPGQTNALLDAIRATMPPLGGVFHAAGMLDDGLFLDQTEERVEKVLAAKVMGAWNLHQHTGEAPLDFFVLFSSVASLTGSPGQSSYAAANAFLDALAHYRRARGLAALSVNWGAWAGGGMAQQTVEAGRRRALPGLRPMSSEQCFTALEGALAIDRPQLAIADADWRQWHPAPRLLSLLLPPQPVQEAAQDDSRILRDLEAAPPARRRRILLDYLRVELGRLLQLDASGPYIDESQPLLRLGMDSLMALEFRNRLAVALRRPLSATLVFDHPTLGELADFLNTSSAAELIPQQPSAALEELEALSDAEAEELLKAELNRT
jgi:acyl transferase domain-containing protein